LQAGEQVVRTTARLSAHLRRLLEEERVGERGRVEALLREVKGGIVGVGEEEVLLEVESLPQMQLVMERPLYEPAKTLILSAEPIECEAAEGEEAALAGLVQAFPGVDEGRLQEQIERVLACREEVRLSEVLSHYPVRGGLSELLGYCLLAAREERHAIDPEASEDIWLSQAGEAHELRVPLISYRRQVAHG
jgi:hypothetical protein